MILFNEFVEQTKLYFNESFGKIQTEKTSEIHRIVLVWYQMIAVCSQNYGEYFEIEDEIHNSAKVLLENLNGNLVNAEFQK